MKTTVLSNRYWLKCASYSAIIVFLFGFVWFTPYVMGILEKKASASEALFVIGYLASGGALVGILLAVIIVRATRE